MDKKWLFDLDDTLIPTNYLYSRAQIEFLAYIAERFGHQVPDPFYIPQ